MDAYFNFFNSHGVGLIRCSFGLVIAVDAFFTYCAIFDRSLPPKIAEWFFTALSGQRAVSAPAGDTVLWWQWISFAFVSAVPVAAWIAFEVYLARHAG
jgi:hypothetical protein